MSERQVIKEIEEYITKLLDNVHLVGDEKREIETEWKQHLYDHYDALRKQGAQKGEAIQTVIQQFGTIPLLQQEINQTYPSSIKNHIYKEIIIAIICIAASIVGPGLLIGAYFQAYFVTTPILALLFAHFIYRYIVKKQTYWLFSIIGLALIYALFIQLFQSIIGNDWNMNTYITNLFSLNWSDLTGENGIFEFTTVHMMWYVIIAMQIISKNNFFPIWQKVCNASFHFWSMLLIGIMLARFQSSAEWAMIYLNVFLLYAFLQQVVSMNLVLVCKERMNRMFVR
ncbi:hypothetical protein ACLM5H_17300 [Fredinandcohnia humi]